MAFARPSSLGSNRWSCSELADGSNHLMASKLEAGGVSVPDQGAWGRLQNLTRTSQHEFARMDTFHNALP